MVAEIEFSVKFWVGIGRCSDRENFFNQKIKSAWKNRSEARIFRRKLYGEFGSWKPARSACSGVKARGALTYARFASLAIVLYYNLR